MLKFAGCALLRAIGPLIALIVYSSAAAWAAPGQSATAEGIYASAPPRLLQIRTVVADAGRQTSIGSGFLTLTWVVCTVVTWGFETVSN